VSKTRYTVEDFRREPYRSHALEEAALEADAVAEEASVVGAGAVVSTARTVATRIRSLKAKP
jgi:hypothetical protein